MWLGWQEEASAYIGAFLDGLVNGVAVTIHIHFHPTPFASLACSSAETVDCRMLMIVMMMSPSRDHHTT